jgi:hypothetical protein
MGFVFLVLVIAACCILHNSPVDDDDEEEDIFGEWEHRYTVAFWATVVTSLVLNAGSWSYARDSHRKEIRRLKEAKLLHRVGNDAMFPPQPAAAPEMGSHYYVWRKELQMHYCLGHFLFACLYVLQTRRHGRRLGQEHELF